MLDCSDHRHHESGNGDTDPEDQEVTDQEVTDQSRRTKTSKKRVEPVDSDESDDADDKHGSTRAFSPNGVLMVSVLLVSIHRLLGLILSRPRSSGSSSPIAK
jgi:hypothetical protein